MKPEEFVAFVKSFLCFHTKTLYKDPVWDRYTDEELIIEYFSVIFRLDKVRKAEFEQSLGSLVSNYDDFLNFANEAIEKNKEELEEQANEYPDSLSFSPDAIGDG